MRSGGFIVATCSVSGTLLMCVRRRQVLLCTCFGRALALCWGRRAKGALACVMDAGLLWLLLRFACVLVSFLDKFGQVFQWGKATETFRHSEMFANSGLLGRVRCPGISGPRGPWRLGSATARFVSARWTGPVLVQSRAGGRIKQRSWFRESTPEPSDQGLMPSLSLRFQPIVVRSRPG